MHTAMTVNTVCIHYCIYQWGAPSFERRVDEGLLFASELHEAFLHCIDAAIPQ